MISDLNKEINKMVDFTENGAVGYKTSGSALVDLNFKLSSFRNMDEKEIYKNFMRAFYENKELAIKWLFFSRDIRGGCGERRTFRIILKNFAIEYQDIVIKLLGLVSVYGRWDDLWCLFDDDVPEEVKKWLLSLIEAQLSEDIDNLNKNKQISLLGKWLPSTNTSSKSTKELSKKIYLGLGIKKAEYTKMLTLLRKYLNVVESQISRNKWSQVDYSSVPSYANLLYMNAFMRHDEERRKNYLDSLKKGSEKINSSATYPHDIVHKYTDGCVYRINQYNETLEQMWKALPNYGSDIENVMFVRDGSGSMTCRIGKTNVSALDVSTALAIYFSERCVGEYKDTFITFGNSPKIIDLSSCNTLNDKIGKCMKETDCSNTDIYKVFKLILNTAIKNKYSQSDLPKNIVIASDMEFDGSTTISRWSCDFKNKMSSLFDDIGDEYKKYGYKMPCLTFWNIMGRTNLIPIQENEFGVKLISGFSPAILDMVLSNETDPYLLLVKKLNSNRYKIIEEVLKDE